MSTILKTLVAGLATATVALAFAQGTPPSPAAANPATGAGQRSSQNTPMGTTGTPTGGGAAAQGSLGTGSASSSAATSAGASSGTMASDSMGSKASTRHGKKSRKHVVKADRG
ncbi:MAG: hypothetical protein JWQ76_2153 [Ramlibacter sp.]|nr:hypothetical protein [Ramlibacter sp.]